MNIPELKIWAKSMLGRDSKDNSYFQTIGIKEVEYSKVRCYLDAVITRCDKIQASTKLNARYEEDIQEFLGQLAKKNITPDDKTKKTEKPIPVPAKGTIPTEADLKSYVGTNPPASSERSPF